MLSTFFCMIYISFLFIIAPPTTSNGFENPNHRRVGES
nr:MAG TPA: hypothetical protein [Bacteriophage sp.]